MSRIDSDLAALLVNRVDSLLSVGPGSTAASQRGVATHQAETQAEAFRPGAASTPPGTPPASAKTALSAMALTLNAIVRSGGAATPAVLGQTPLWPGISGMPGELPAQPGVAGFSGGNATATPAATTQAAATQATTAQAAAAAARSAGSAPAVTQMVQALRQTVAQSGLFYEAHLAQWLAGQRPLSALLAEPQNRLVSVSPWPLPLPLPMPSARPSGTDAFADGPAEPSGFSPRWAASGKEAGANASGAAHLAATSSSETAAPLAQALSSRLAAASQAMAERLAGFATATTPEVATRRLYHAPADTLGALSAEAGDTEAGVLPVIHPATAPLVRQQLDLLATGQFRWNGEAWPGAKLDWTIEHDDAERRRRGTATEAPAATSERVWRTRVTLSLPVLGTVDAELTLTGVRLAVRLQASTTGAARLVQQGEQFGQRLAAAGIELNGLLIRAVADEAGLWANGAHAAQAQAATSAYAQSAAATSAASSASGGGGFRHGADAADWDFP